MPETSIEQRLTRVEELLSAVLMKLDALRPMPWTNPSGEESAGELFDPALEIREQDREIARKKFAHEKFLPANPFKGNWTDTVGMFGNDPVLKQIAEEALRLREVDRQAARREASDVETDPS